MDRRKIDIYLSTFLIVISAIILTNNNLVEGGAESNLSSMFLPRFSACLIIIFSLTIAIQSLMKLARKSEIKQHEIIETEGLSGVYIYIGILITYWISMLFLGFLISTPFIMIAVAVLLGGRRWVSIISMSVITSLIIFYGSKFFLRVYLPTWSL
ncbi:tripartite tricarboxylate transporter TctB family protein [Marinomonas pollencensis]|uniref:Tripartite tricarboxylate transporter TctB family protein n=1 Tax=Marinomonas pollencensis TaxID=491954 RepID=A0A3E0DM66_9GAMM|nr:tripartite tricarboxylate transporter TctB family protein [Marinomonas pollencensis]REG83175.1 tripartite tricarboxylate transporter TctB family protein [Marinomonas pollencensis]